MKDLLVGSTGFVGTNIKRAHDFTSEVHSTNIMQAFGLKPDLCVYAGVPAAMYLANHAPERDFAVVESAIENLKRIHPKIVVLISTIAVYADSRGKTEDDDVQAQDASMYGKNRFYLEERVRTLFDKHVVVRLPALFGSGLKKNFLYDLHHIIPAMLPNEKYEELSMKSELIHRSYVDAEYGFMRLKQDAKTKELKECFSQMPFNALSFTDAKSRFQFYGLDRLWLDIQIALENGLETLNISTPPISAKEVYRIVMGRDDWDNRIDHKAPFDYDMRTKYGSFFKGKDGYIMDKDSEIRSIARFMEGWK